MYLHDVFLASCIACGLAANQRWTQKRGARYSVALTLILLAKLAGDPNLLSNAENLAGRKSLSQGLMCFELPYPFYLLTIPLIVGIGRSEPGF